MRTGLFDVSATSDSHLRAWWEAGKPLRVRRGCAVSRIEVYGENWSIRMRENEL